MERETTHQWHVAINRHHDGQRERKHWMYEAKAASMEVPRLTRLFQREREGALPAVHRQCSQAQAGAGCGEPSHVLSWRALSGVS